MAKIRKREWTTEAGEKKVAWAVNFYDANGKRGRKQFSSRREADEFRIRIEGELRTGSFRPEAAKVTVGDVADLFLAHCKGRMERRERMTQGNFNFYDGHIHNYICPDPKRWLTLKRSKRRVHFQGGIGAIKLAQLSARAVSDFRDRLRSAGLAVPTVRKILSTLQQMLAYAISRDLIAVNVAKDIAVIGRRDEQAKKIVPPSKEVMRRLIDAADPDFRVKLVLAVATGVRASELHALRWRHIDFDRREVTIETRVDPFGKEDVTKTAAGMRTIPISASVIKALTQWSLALK